MKKQQYSKPTKVTIDVTKEDIKRGIAGDSRVCAVARAIRRTFKLPVSRKTAWREPHARVSVGGGRSIHLRDYEVHNVSKRQAIERFINKFDSQTKQNRKAILAKLKPFKFTITVQDETPEEVLSEPVVI